MFNINISVKPENLTDEMLLNEVRNINFVCKLFKKELSKHIEPTIPESPSFSDKNISAMFFLDKGKYTEDRYIALRDECSRRGFTTIDHSQDWNIYLNTGYYNDYTPSDNDIEIADTYIKFILGNKWANFVEDDYFGEYPFHYYGKKISFSKLISLL